MKCASTLLSLSTLLEIKDRALARPFGNRVYRLERHVKLSSCAHSSVTVPLMGRMLVKTSVLSHLLSSVPYFKGLTISLETSTSSFCNLAQVPDAKMLLCVKF